MIAFMVMLILNCYFAFYFFKFVDVSIFMYMFQIVQFLFLKTNLNKISIHDYLAYSLVTLC
jgi:hypothetical protein